jgi:hypothetical protein
MEDKGGGGIAGQLEHDNAIVSGGNKRAFITYSALSFLELLTIALTRKRFQVIWQLKLGVVGGFNQEMVMSAMSS